MNRNNYDDWNFMGKSLTGTVPGETKTYNYRRNSVVLFTVFLVLIIYGLVCTYSTTYPQAITEGKNHYYYLQNQLLYIVVGLGIGSVFYFISEKAFETLSPLTVLVIFAFCAASELGMNAESSLVSHMAMLGITMYLTHYFGKRNNRFDRLREIALPLLFSTAFFGIITLQKNVMLSLVYIILVVYLFAVGGVGLGGVSLLILFIAVPFVCSFLSNPAEIRELLNFFIPGLFTGSDAAQSVLRYKSISSGGLMGKGSALGVYKYGVINGISGPYILCSIFEEFGFAGFCLIAFLFIVIAILGYGGSNSLKSVNYYYSNLCNGMTTLLVWHFIFNCAAVFEVLPFSFLSMPFFSYGPDVSLVIIEFFLLLKTFKKEKEKSEMPVYEKYDYSEDPVPYEK
ncbi:MAG: FtsW/RodA/SpoVE family cell cycle protein [Sphaerochaetaceae bacterium]|nr:FtsW/RodA/SpoVE family cell cycle protein [Sphaerochaetaceae bacterium]